MRRLQQVHAVVGHIGCDGSNVVWPVQRTAQHGGIDRLAGTMRHRANKGRDGRQRCGLAFAVTNQPTGRDAHQQRVLAAIGLGGDLWHGQIKEIYGINLHVQLALSFVGWLRRR